MDIHMTFETSDNRSCTLVQAMDDKDKPFLTNLHKLLENENSLNS